MGNPAYTQLYCRTPLQQPFCGSVTRREPCNDDCAISVDTMATRNETSRLLTASNPSTTAPQIPVITNSDVNRPATRSTDDLNDKYFHNVNAPCSYDDETFLFFSNRSSSFF